MDSSAAELLVRSYALRQMEIEPPHPSKLSIELMLLFYCSYLRWKTSISSIMLDMLLSSVFAVGMLLFLQDLTRLVYSEKKFQKVSIPLLGLQHFLKRELRDGETLLK